jgi:SAM-dependent methyltransferase
MVIVDIYKKRTFDVDIANDFPNCKIVGLDAVDPYCPLEPNCVTVKGDLFARLPFKDNSMDYVHQRMMLVLYPNHSVDTLFKDILRVTKPNGWIEMVEPELNPKSAGPLFAKLFKAGKGNAASH